MYNFVTIFEMSPRDGLQNEKKFISTNDKVKFIDKLSLCGFKKIETSSFVSSRWVPQLADASEVFIKIKRNKNIKYIKRNEFVSLMRHMQLVVSELDSEYAVIFHDDDVLHPDYMNIMPSFLNNNKTPLNFLRMFDKNKTLTKLSGFGKR